MIKKLENAIFKKHISKPSFVETPNGFPFHIAISLSSLTSGCREPENAYKRRVATGCAVTKNDAGFLAMMEAVERYSIQYDSSRGDSLPVLYSTSSADLKVLQEMTCLGVPFDGYQADSVGAAAGDTLVSATKRAILEMLEHIFIENDIVDFQLVRLNELASIRPLRSWLNGQYRELEACIYRSKHGFYVAKCLCSDYDLARSTVGSAASFSPEVAIKKAAEEAIVFYRNMSMLESNCLVEASFNKEEILAIKLYRGALERDISVFKGTHKVSVRTFNNRKDDISVESLIELLSSLKESDISIVDLTSSVISVPVVKVSVH